jgi:hypothetical protein
LARHGPGTNRSYCLGVRISYWLSEPAFHRSTRPDRNLHPPLPYLRQSASANLRKIQAPVIFVFHVEQNQPRAEISLGPNGKCSTWNKPPAPPNGSIPLAATHPQRPRAIALYSGSFPPHACFPLPPLQLMGSHPKPFKLNAFPSRPHKCVWALSTALPRSPQSNSCTHSALPAKLASHG